MAALKTPATEPSAEEPRALRLPAAVLAVTVFLATIVTGNLTGLGLGELPLLYDYVALPRLAVTGLGALAALAAWAWAARADGAVRVDPIAGLLALVAALAAVSTVFGHDPLFSVLGQSERLEGLVAFIGYAVLYLIALQVLRHAENLWLVGTALVAGALVNAAYGLSQFLGFDPASYVVSNPGFELRRSFATFENPNFLAGLLVLALPIAVALALRARSAGARVAWWLGVGLLGVVLLATATRGAWLAAAVQAVLLVGIMRRSKTKLERVDRIVLVTLMVAALAVVGISLSRAGEANFFERLTSSAAGASVEQRFEVWETAVLAAADRPLLGYGPDAFLAAFRAHRMPAYAAEFGAAATTNNAHDWPLQVAATIGIPAALAFVAAIVWALVRGRKLVRGSSADLLRGVAWVACIGYGIHMLSNVAVSGASTPFWLLLGAVAAPLAASRTVSRTLLVALFAVTCALALAWSAISVRLIGADMAYLDARAQYRAGAIEQSIDSANTAVARNPLSVKYSRGEAQSRAELFYALKASGASERDVRAAFDAADTAFLNAIERHPDDYATLAWHSALLLSGGGAFDDQQLFVRAQQVATRARTQDVDAAEVIDIVRGSTEPSAGEAAMGVPALP